ncbi:MAG: hypothetical protein IIZ40_00575 [Bacilli bacterium]|nr:hypothetical protein [Bacilli bacterium]
MENIKEEKQSHFFRTLFFILVLILALIILYGKYIGNKGIIIKDYDINNNNIPTSFNNFKIAHFSDILYSGNNDDEIDELIKKINDKKVDIVIFSGNLTKKNYKLNKKKTDYLISKLKSINSNYGKYFVSGLDDKKNPSYETIMTSSGFISLNDSKDTIFSKVNESILLVGLDSNKNTSFIKDIMKDNTSTYKIITFSESDQFDEIKDYNFDLVLTSNSLNGQINIPVIKEILKRDGSSKYIDNYYKYNNTDIYVNSGIGVDKINFRLFNKPCLNIYNLKK